jgi:hypothetical protein
METLLNAPAAPPASPTREVGTATAVPQTDWTAFAASGIELMPAT